MLFAPIALALLSVATGSASAAPVLVYDGGEVRESDSLAAGVPEFAPLAPPPPGQRLQNLGLHPRSRAGVSGGDPVKRAIRRARKRRAISGAEARSYRRIYRQGRRTARRLGGTRASQMRSVLNNTRFMARRGRLTASRMPAVFLIVRRNAQWWPTRRIPRSWERVTFAGSRVLFQYYPGEGLQFHPNGNFGAVNAFLKRDTPNSLRAARQLLDELVGLRCTRAGYVTWEWYFYFGGGSPPWTQALSQGTAMKALSRGARKLNRPRYQELALRGRGAFAKRTPRGVRVPLGGDGSWYALYSFAPGLRVLNGHMNGVNGLYTLGVRSQNGEVMRLYRRGKLATERRIGAFDTGAWSKYANPGREADLNYHKLNRDFARELCGNSKSRTICRRADNFSRYLKEEPGLFELRAGSSSVRFFLSKVSNVRVYVRRESGGSFQQKAHEFLYRGRHTIGFSRPSRGGTYRLLVVARDLAGNKGSETRTITVG